MNKTVEAPGRQKSEFELKMESLHPIFERSLSLEVEEGALELGVNPAKFTWGGKLQHAPSASL